MDDEAIIRTTAIIVVGLVVGVTLMILAIGWAHNQGPAPKLAAAAAGQTKQLVSACQRLPEADKVACISTLATSAAVNSGNTPQDNAIGVCDKIVDNDKAIVACITSAMTPQIPLATMIDPPKRERKASK
jgi:hypothetical protein